MRMRPVTGSVGWSGKVCAPSNVLGSIGEAYLIGHEELGGVVEALLVVEHLNNATVCFVLVQVNLVCGGIRGIERRHRRVQDTCPCMVGTSKAVCPG